MRIMVPIVTGVAAMVVGQIYSAQGQASLENVLQAIRIKGHVVDPAGYPLPHATITLNVFGSDKPSAELLTDENGFFALPSVSQQKYVLRLAERGFKSRTMEVEKQTTERDIDVGVVVCFSTSIVLD